MAHLFFISFITFTGNALVITYLTKQNIPTNIINFYLVLVFLIVVLIEMFIKKIKINFNKSNILIMLGIGISTAIYNYFVLLGFKNAPNPGYISAASIASIAILTVLYKLIFKDELTRKKMIGIIGIIIGMIILFI